VHQNTTLFCATKTIHSQAQVKTETEYKAEEEIQLNSGFETYSYYNFGATISVCR